MAKGFKWNVMKCDCGAKVTALIYHTDGHKTCANCKPTNLSGNFLRRMEGEKQYYAKDLLQPGDEGFEQLYGEGRNIKKM